MSEPSSSSGDPASSKELTPQRQTPPAPPSGLRPRLLRAVHPELVVAVIVFALVSLILHVPTFIGMADSHDFNRLMGPVGIQYPHLSENVLYFHWVNREYPLGSPYASGGTYPSSTILILALAAPISRLLHGATFDLALVGWIYTVLFACAAYLIVRGLRSLIPSRGVVWAICVIGGVIFLDVAYTAYFNSMYSEPTSFVFLFLGLGAALNLLARRRPSYVMLAILTISVGFFATNKLQDLPLAVLAALVMLWLMRLDTSHVWRTSIVVAALAIVLCAGLTYTAIPTTYHQAATYNAVFDGILLDATPSQARAILVEMGTDPSYVSLVGQNYYTDQSLQIDQSPAFIATFFDRVSATTMVRVYLSHPALLVAGLQRSATGATVMRPDYLGNYTPDTGLPATTQTNRLALWSALKSRFFPTSLWLLAIGLLLYFAGIGWEYSHAHDRSTRALVLLYALVGVMTLVALPIPYVFAGDSELVKHLFTFDTLCDLTLVIACGWIILRLEQALTRSMKRARTSTR